MVAGLATPVAGLPDHPQRPLNLQQRSPYDDDTSLHPGTGDAAVTPVILTTLPWRRDVTSGRDELACGAVAWQRAAGREAVQPRQGIPDTLTSRRQLCDVAHVCGRSIKFIDWQWRSQKCEFGKGLGLPPFSSVFPFLGRPER